MKAYLMRLRQRAVAEVRFLCKALFAVALFAVFYGGLAWIAWHLFSWIFDPIIEAVVRWMA